MTRESADQLVKKYIATKNLIFHSYAVEAVMRALAKELKPEQEKLWGLTGLLHDLDYDIVNKNNTMELHATKTVELLKDHGVGNERMYNAILAHNFEQTGQKPEQLMDYAIYSADPITGLIIATALVHPEKKLSNVRVESVLKKMKDKSFAASVNREAIKEIEKVGISLEKFVGLSLEAMQEISDTIGL